MLTLLAFRALASAMDDDTRQIACAGAIIRHGAVWAACGCNPLTIGIHAAAIAIVYGDHEEDR
jgi:hypothetical protein